MNPKTIASPRYADEVLAWEYDCRNSELSNGELEWYLSYAVIANGPILELACGSGRLLIPIAKAGYQIDGVDNAEAMLNRLKAKLCGLDRKTRGHIQVFHADMVDFQPTRRYDLVFIGFNSLQYLETRERILECFQRIHSFLNIGGFFLFMVQRLDLSEYENNTKKIIDWLDKPVIDQERGITVGSRFVSFLEPDGNRIVKERTYQLSQPTGESWTLECVTFTPVLTIADYKFLLAQAGFMVKIFNGYQEQPEDGFSSLICVVCQRLS